jgi:hypoxanthine phosphoribosyltransferase
MRGNRVEHVLRHRILFDEMAIATRVEQLAIAISKDLPDPAPLVIGILTGSFIFVADLVRALSRLNVQPQVDFMAVSHYGVTTESSGLVKIVKDVTLDVSGRPVLVVDDILDTGRSLSLARDLVRARGPIWLRTCVLLDKPSRRTVPSMLIMSASRFLMFVIGFGLDAAERRALHVAAVELKMTAIVLVQLPSNRNHTVLSFCSWTRSRRVTRIAITIGVSSQFSVVSRSGLQVRWWKPWGY